MQFGRIQFDQLDSIDWSFPSAHPQAERVLKSTTPGSFNLYLGCTGWSNKSWKGDLYPGDLKDKEMLSYYGQLFNSVELNASHYRIPNPDWVDRWTKEVPRGFKFCPKLHQQISHRGLLMGKDSMLEQFWDFLEQLGDFHGCTFLQLPERYGPESGEDFKAFLDNWPSNYALAIEFRHPEWFMPHSPSEDVWGKMQDRGITSVITDTAGRRDVLHLRLTTPNVMIRFVGNHPHESDQTRLQAWVQQLSAWEKEGLQNVWFFLHQHENKGIANSTGFFADQWNASSRHPIQVPNSREGQGQLGLF